MAKPYHLLDEAEQAKMWLPWRFFAQRLDYNRRLGLFFLKEDSEGKLWPCALRLIDGPNPFYPQATLSGNEDFANLLEMKDAQQLFDAMWEAGLRPTRA